MMQVKEIDFVSSDNAQAYNGQTVEIDVGFPNKSARDGGWLTGSNRYGNPLNRKIQRYDDAGNVVNAYRSQEIDGRMVLWASSAVIQAGKDQFAVVSEGTDFENIWSAWRGQRWVFEANVDDAVMSFQDLWEFHFDEVFRDVEITKYDFSSQSIVDASNDISWIDENTMDVSSVDIAFGTQTGFSMSIEDSSGDVRTMRGEGQRLSWASATSIKLLWVQYTDSEGDVVVYEEGEMTEGLRVYDSNNAYEGRQETVVREELNYLTPGYGDGIVDFKIYHITSDDNVETGDIDEEANYWQIRQMTPSGSGVWTWLEPRYTNQIEADTALDEILAEYDALSAEAMVDVDARNAAAQATANAAAMAAARDVGKEAKAKRKRDEWLDKYLIWIILGGAGLVMIWFMTRTKSGSSSSSSKSSSTKSGSSE